MDSHFRKMVTFFIFVYSSQEYPSCFGSNFSLRNTFPAQLHCCLGFFLILFIL